MASSLLERHFLLLVTINHIYFLNLFFDTGCVSDEYKLVTYRANIIVMGRFLYVGLESVSDTIAIISGIAAVVVFFFEFYRTWNSKFNDCAEKINNSGNRMAQLASAIQLRDYINKRFLFFSHKKNALALVCSILKDNKKSSTLQKTLGDSLSFVGKAQGLDLQGANLFQVCIKPQNRVQFEISGDPIFNIRSIDLQGADMYKATISESTICNVLFDKAVFSSSMLCRSRFHNCSLIGAKFSGADVNGCKFYACDLIGADFNGARGVADATVNLGEKGNKEYTDVPLVYFLDKDGVFGNQNQEQLYYEKTSAMTVFLSKLGLMNAKQDAYNIEIQKDLKSKYGATIHTIEREAYSDVGQLDMISREISQCNGFVVLAFAHMQVNDGLVRKDRADEMETLTNVHYSSPWLQIETAFARSMGLPCLIIAEDGNLRRNGMFDESIVDADNHLYYVTYKGYFSEADYDVIDEWKKAVESM